MKRMQLHDHLPPTPSVYVCLPPLDLLYEKEREKKRVTTYSPKGTHLLNLPMMWLIMKSEVIRTMGSSSI